MQPDKSLTLQTLLRSRRLYTYPCLHSARLGSKGPLMVSSTDLRQGVI